MSALAVIAILFGLSVACSVGVVIGAWLSWCSYDEGFKDGLRWYAAWLKKREGGRW